MVNKGRNKIIGATGYRSGLGGTENKAILLASNPQNIAIQKLACGVIFEAAKSYPEDATKIFFKSDDYQFWAALAGIDVTGMDILRALECNNGVNEHAAILFRESIKGDE